MTRPPDGGDGKDGSSGDTDPTPSTPGDADAAAEASEEDAPGSTAATLLGHPGVATPRPPKVADAEREMDKLMRGAMPTVPSDQSGMRPRVLVEDDDGASVSAADLSLSGSRDADASDDGPASGGDVAAKVEDPPSSSARPALRVLASTEARTEAEDDDGSPEGPESEEDEVDEADSGPAAKRTAVVARRPVPPPDEPPAPEPGLSTGAKMLIGAIGAALIVGLGWSFARGTGKPSRDRPRVEPPPAAPIQPSGAPPRTASPRRDPAAGETGAGDGTTTDGESDGGDDAGGESTGAAIGEGEPRRAPAGTSPEAAAAYEKLPLSPADRPPVGGIGASGIHVDRITVGSSYEDQDCAGKRDEFSVDAGDRVSVCVRIVHPRDKEEVVVLWQMKDGTARRGKMTVKPSHGYRTRAYLKLRREYVGDWTVRILSNEDVELARTDFTVVD